MVPPSINDTTPGLVLGVVHKGDLVISKAYGMANLSYSIPNSSEMLYNLGSVSKQFLGYAFAILHTQGKLDVDEPVGKYLDEWPDFEQEVSIRHLLTHTSGYREAYTMSNLAGRLAGTDRLSRAECLDVVRKQPDLEFRPGSHYTYNSTAYVILAEVLEKITGEEAHIWVSKNIFSPLGMTNTRIESFVGEVIENAAESYYYDQEKGYGNPKSNRAIFGAADVYSSIEDLVKWQNNFHSQEVGDQESMALFLEPYILLDGNNTEYGFGIRHGIHKGLKVYSHTGAHESFLTQIRYYPEHELGIIAISNFGGQGWLQTNKLAEYVLKDFMQFPKQKNYEEYRLPLKKLRAYEGTYLAPFRNNTNTLTLVNDTLTIWGGTKLIPISENRFYATTWGGEFEFVKSKNQATELVIHGDTKSNFFKLPAWDPSTEDLKEYESDYTSKELETTYHVILKEDALSVQHRWLGEINLNPISKDLFESDWGWFFEFKRSELNEIIGFDVSGRRTLNVFFEKE